MQHNWQSVPQAEQMQVQVAAVPALHKNDEHVKSVISYVLAGRMPGPFPEEDCDLITFFEQVVCHKFEMKALHLNESGWLPGVNPKQDHRVLLELVRMTCVGYQIPFITPQQHWERICNQNAASEPGHDSK